MKLAFSFSKRHSDVDLEKLKKSTAKKLNDVQITAQEFPYQGFIESDFRLNLVADNKTLDKIVFKFIRYSIYTKLYDYYISVRANENLAVISGYRDEIGVFNKYGRKIYKQQSIPRHERFYRIIQIIVEQKHDFIRIQTSYDVIKDFLDSI